MEAFSRAARRFSAFFAELNANFLEREDVLTQTALALLSREHVLLTGPPGTAKSQLARAVLGNIVDATTGEPSLFARQFTENTVLTDLIGAVDFKTLMETGRSEHFTDEGIIGSVHAFLDEVFDGRDMLLRSTLNLLGERELKQGVRTTRGRVECSLMTSNRYLTEVLDESRETLLAFVDRIAFVGFVPKGFSDPEPMRRVMRQNVIGRPARLQAYLSIQDIDVLQEAVQRVHCSDQACDRLVSFLDVFDAELQAAVRAIPDFSPSRYLSIRTRVRAGKILKAVVVYRKLFESPERPLEVLLSDFKYLRHVLLQSGPPAALLAKLAQEQDPREARQLKIIQTERDVFERSLARLDQTAWDAGASSEPLPLPALEQSTPEELLLLLQRASRTGVADAAQVQQLSQLVMRSIIERGLSSSGGGPDERAGLARLADDLEGLRGPLDPLTLWLRARCLSLLEAAAQRLILSAEVTADTASRGAAAIELLHAILEQMQLLQAQADELRARYPRLDQSRLNELLFAVAGAAVNRLRESLHQEVTAALAEGAGDGTVERLRPVLAAFDVLEAAALQTHPAFAPLLNGLAAPLLWPVLSQALGPLASATRQDYLASFDRIWARLSDAHLARHAPFDELLKLALATAVEHDRTKLGQIVLPPSGGCSADAYAAFRQAVPRATLSYLCVQLCLRADASSIVEFAGKAELSIFAERLAKLPAGLRDAIWRLDAQRVALSLAFFEAWLAQGRRTGSREVPSDLLDVLARDEALARLRLESDLIEAVLPEAAAECQRLRAALDALLQELSRAGEWQAPHS